MRHGPTYAPFRRDRQHPAPVRPGSSRLL